jgi:hypothetical protein
MGGENMVGYNADDPCQPGVACGYSNAHINQLGTWTTGGHSAGGNDNGLVVTAVDPLEFPGATQSTTTMSGVGPGMSFAHTYWTRTGYNVLLVPCALATSTVCDWVSNSNNVFSNCINAATTALALQSNTSIDGMLWMGGENACTAAYTYTEALITLVEDVRDTFNSHTIPFVVAQMARPFVAANPSYQTTQTDLTNVPFISTTDLENAGVYNTYNGQYTGYYSAVVYSLDQTNTPFPISGLLSGGALTAYGTRKIGVAFDAALQAAALNALSSTTSPPVVQIFAPASAAINTYITVSWTYNYYNDQHACVVGGGIATTSGVGVSSCTFAVTNNQVSPMIVGVSTTRSGSTTANPGISIAVGVTSAAPNASYTGPTPLLWLQADTLTGLTDGASVLAWQDTFSGSGASLVSSASQTPVFKLNPANVGHSAVRFAGSAVLTTYASYPANAQWVFMVMANGAMHLPSTFLAGTAASFQFTINQTAWAVCSTSACASAYWLSGTDVGRTYSPTEIAFQQSGSNVEMYKTGIAQTSAPVTIAQSSSLLNLGGFPGASNYVGDIYELMVFNSSASSISGAFDAIDTYLVNKYSICATGHYLNCYT